MAGNVSSKSYKRLIVGCDGTWMVWSKLGCPDCTVICLQVAKNGDSNFEPPPTIAGRKPGIGRILKPSNITRMCRAIRTTSRHNDNEISQITLYQPGIGTEGNWWDHYVNGATGFSLAENVREAYGFLCNNYEEGDEIILLGFSRGAFTARSIGALISQVGLLTYEGMENFYTIFSDWEQQDLGQTFTFHDEKNLNWLPRTGDVKSSYTRCLEEKNLTRSDIKLKAIACFDTVGALGIPVLPWFRRLQQIPPLRWFQTPPPFSFVDQEVLPNVENCFQALALDEHRRSFTPTLWELPENLKSRVNLKQCWFPGVHNNIGGSVDDAELSNITLAWMTSQLKDILEFDESHLRFAQTLNKKYYKDNSLDGPQWAMGYISESYKAYYLLDGSSPRTPLQYHQTDPITGKSKNRLRNTNEFIHPSVRVRQTRHGTGPDGKGLYKPPALANFALVSLADGACIPVQSGHNPFQSDLGYVLWDSSIDRPVTDETTGKPVVIPEDTLCEFEPRLYQGGL